jgi:uridine phosphorylase
LPRPRGWGLRYHVGITRSADTFYAGHPRPGSSYANYWQSWWESGFDDLQRLNVVAAEMEASIIFVLARVWRLRAGGVSVVLDNVRRVSGEEGVFDPAEQIDHSAEYVQRLCELGCEIVRELHERDVGTGSAPESI